MSFVAAAVAALFGLSASAALAADLALPALPEAPVWSWTGVYFGVNAGGAQFNSSWCTDATTVSCSSTHPIDVVQQSGRDALWGVTGGGQFIARWQPVSVLVIGAELDLDGMHLRDSTVSCISLGACTAATIPGLYRTTIFDSLISTTGELGLALGRFLAYGKGGAAWTDLSLDAVNSVTGVDLSNQGWVSGWTAGAGMEFLLSTHWTVGVEYDYYQFDISNITNLTNTGGAVIPCAFCNFNKNYVQTVTARMNFKLWPITP